MVFKYSLSDRNASLVALRCIAAFLITQSHLEAIIPPQWQVLVVGADVGDALFFFCAGYALFLGRASSSFVEWFVRKIVRLWPSFLVMGLISALLLGSRATYLNVILFHGYWFVQALLIYFLILYWVKKYFVRHLSLVMVFSYLALMAYGLTFHFEDHFQLYSRFSFFSKMFFPVMLAGAAIGYSESLKTKTVWGFWRSLILVVVSLAVHYGTKIAIICGLFNGFCQIQLLSMWALLTLTFGLYKLFQGEWFSLERGWCGRVVYLIASLTLEIYIVNPYVIARMPKIFPLNIPLTFVCVVFAAWTLRCATNVFLQLIKDHRIELRKIPVVD